MNKLEKLVCPLQLTIDMNQQKVIKECDAVRKLCLEKDIEQQKTAQEFFNSLEKFDRTLKQMDVDEKVQRTMTIINRLIEETSQQNFEIRNRWQRLATTSKEFMEKQNQKNEKADEDRLSLR